MPSQKQAGWSNSRHESTWIRSLETYAFPRIGGRLVSEVTSADVLEVLTPIWHEKAQTARRVRQRIRTVLEWAVAMELRPDNPCDRIGPVLGPQRAPVQHMRALPHRDVPAAVEAVQTSGAAPSVKLAFEFLVLTAAAVGRGSWGRVGRDRHVRPCVDDSRSADEGEARAPGPAVPAGGGDSRGGADARRRLRSTFRDWAAEETNHPREVVEAALAHMVQNKVEAAYARSDLFERRRRLMSDWAAYIDGDRRSAIAAESR